MLTFGFTLMWNEISWVVSPLEPEVVFSNLPAGQKHLRIANNSFTNYHGRDVCVVMNHVLQKGRHRGAHIGC